MSADAAPGRKDWIENRLKELDQIFAVSVGGFSFSLMDNHLHLLLRIDPDVASGWSRVARLGSTPQTWGVRMAKLTGGRLLGRFLAASRERLRQLANKLQVRHLANVG